MCPMQVRSIPRGQEPQAQRPQAQERPHFVPQRQHVVQEHQKEDSSCQEAKTGSMFPPCQEAGLDATKARLTAFIDENSTHRICSKRSCRSEVYLGVKSQKHNVRIFQNVHPLFRNVGILCRSTQAHTHTHTRP